MSRISTSSIHDSSLNALLDQQLKLSESQLKISSGKNFSTPADDPISVSRLLGLKESVSLIEQYQTSIDAADFQLSSQELRYKSIENNLSRFRQLTIQAGNGSLSDSELGAIKVEMQGLLDSLVSLANSNENGEYIFSGSKGFVKPVIKDINGNYIYNGDELTRKANISDSASIKTSETAKNIFFNIPTKNLNLNLTQGQASIDTAASGLVNSGSLGVLDAAEIYINGITIPNSIADTVSTTDNTASAIAIANSINSVNTKHGVIATVNKNILDFTGGNYTTGLLSGTDFSINGVNIVGTPASADASGLADLINSLNIDGIVASDNSGELRLTAADGRNIQLETDGTVAGGLTFTNFDLTSVQNQVQRSTVTLTDHKDITIAGSNPSEVGLTAGITTNTATSNASISTPYFADLRPDSVSDTEKYLIKFNSSNTYSIYRESDPLNPVTDFKVFAKNEKIDNAKSILNSDVSYTEGDSVIIDGISFSITGTPAINDTFTIEVSEIQNQNIFKSLDDIIYAVSNYGGDNARLSFEVSKALDNIISAEKNITEIHSELGSIMQLAESQKSSNEQFMFFAQKGISQIEDLDMSSAISDLMKHKIAFEAAQRSILQISRLSLFDYM